MSVATAEMTLALGEILGDNGYAHYASCASGGFDYAKPGSECGYERGHWAAPQDQFLGLGPGAFGFLGGRTTVNGLGIPSYIAALEHERLPLVSATKADGFELRRRYFVLGVKTLAVDLAPYRALFGDEPVETFSTEFKQLVNHGLAVLDDASLRLTPLGRLFVDTVSSVFFSGPERDVPHPEEPEIRRMEVWQAQRVSRMA